MKAKILTIMLFTGALLFSQASKSDENSYQQFLELRENVYSAWQSGNYGKSTKNEDAPLRRNNFQKALSILNEYIQDTSKFTAHELKKVQTIMELDKSTDYSYKRLGSGIKGEFYHTSYGARISTQCFKYMDKISHYKGRKEKFRKVKQEAKSNARLRNPFEIEEALDKLFRTSINQMQTCAKNYPSLKENIARWLRTIKKIDIICRGNVSYNLGKGGSYNHRTKNIEIPYDNFAKFISLPTYRTASFPQEVFIHEILHAGRVNKNANHNSEKGRLVSSVTCNDKDTASDMVYYVSRLCLGFHEEINYSHNGVNKRDLITMDQLMALKIEKCGMQKGCLKYHRKEKNPAKFCTEMQKMGLCKLDLPKPTMSFLVDLYSKKLAKKIADMLTTCTRLVAASFDHEKAMTMVSNLKEKAAKCSSAKFYSSADNKPLQILYKNLNSYNLFRDALLTKDHINYFKNTARFSGVLTSDEWKILEEYTVEISDNYRTKICRDKLNWNQNFQTIDNVRSTGTPCVACGDSI